MGDFVFHLFDTHEKTYHMFSAAFDDVESVLSAAKRLSYDYSVEVWSGGARVVNLKRGCASPYQEKWIRKPEADYSNNGVEPNGQERSAILAA